MNVFGVILESVCLSCPSSYKLFVILLYELPVKIWCCCIKTTVKPVLETTCIKRPPALTHSHTMTPFDAPGKQAF